MFKYFAYFVTCRAEQDEKVAHQMMEQLSMEEEEELHRLELKDAVRKGLSSKLI